MSRAQVAWVTCPVAHAGVLARGLVEARVAACVNILPTVTSIYRWKDEVSQDDEALLMIKTTADAFEDLKREVLARHPYELPEIIAVDIAAGNAPYLEWIAASIGSPHS